MRTSCAKPTGHVISIAISFSLVIFLLLSNRANAQVKDSTVTGVYTSFKSYWASSTASNSTTLPDSSHNLLAFTFRGKTYSTGVNNTILNNKLGSGNYSAQVFKALPVNNITGTVIAGGATYYATAIKNDGDSTKAAYAAPYPTIRIADALTDGKFGLDLGTGVTNLPKGARISFTLKNLSTKAATDTIPDMLLTQIADPSGNVPDTIYFYDANGNVVGNKRLVNWNSVNKLGSYKLDLYSFQTGVACNTASINGVVSSTPTRDIRMVAYLITEFGITNADSTAKVKGITIATGGTSDQAFIAYNTNILNIDVPTITSEPLSQTFCTTTTTSATFSVVANSATAMTYQWKKNGAAISGATSSSYTASGLTLADTANTYTVTVTNGVGSVTSDPAYIKYTIVAQPASRYIATGSSATFTVKASGATGFQWYKNGASISGATSASYTVSSATLAMSGNSYYAIVSTSGESCTSSTATLTVENLPAITAQPTAQVLCNTSTTTTTFSVTAGSTSATTYQWYNGNTAIPGATSSSFSASGLTLADTSNTYKVIVTNGVGSTTSNSIGFKYLVLTQPANQYVSTGTSVTLSVTSSDITTGYQWQKGGINIPGATSRTYTIASPTLLSSGNYNVIVYYPGGSCNSTTATVEIENLPVITTQPALQVLCNNSVTSATYSVVGSSISVLGYQWYKNGTLIPGATSSSYTTTGLSYADTTNTYSVRLSNGVGYITSSSAGLKYLILSQPTPASAYIATGNTTTFTASVSSAATAFQWRKDGMAVSGANRLSYRINTVDTNSGGNYTLAVSYAGGSCISNAGVLTAATVLYSKAMGDINSPATWGVMPDGSGSAPVDFTRTEHTFIIANRAIGTQASNLTIAGTYDLGDTVTTISPGTTLEAGRIIRTKTKGRIAGSATSNLVVHGKSDLYFDAANKILKNLTVSTDDTVTLRSALNITGGKGRGIVKIASGVFNTGDSLVLKSDSLGAACVGNSPGRITGKVTVEQYIPSHRAWRLFASPVSDSLAPTIHEAWQEGAVSSTDDPHPGYGTHITYGAVSDGFDQNPQKTFSMKVKSASGEWIGVSATNTTKVTDYPAYFLFIRGNRAYDIEHTTIKMESRSTILRTTGYLRQHGQPNVTVNNTSYTLVSNPYASPIDFQSVIQHSSISQHFYMWNPSLAGDKGVGAYVLVYWNGSGYSTTPALHGADSMRFLQANQGFFVKGNGGISSIDFNENDKDTASLITPFGREVAANTPRLEINLNVFDDGTASVADGATYLFSNSFNSGIDYGDISKLANVNENAGILSNGKLLALEQRALPVDKDSLQLNLTNTRSASYQFDIIPNKMDNFHLYLYDRYTGTKTPLNATDTNHIMVDINTSVEASKAANRFVIISKTVAPPAVMFTHINAVLQEEAIQVNWSAINEGNVLYYKLQRSADGINFTDVTSITPSGKEDYNYTDSKPLPGMNYYRVQSINRTGSPSFTGIVSEAFTRNLKSYIAVSPNPLTTNRCTIELHNKPAGKYSLTLTNSNGSTVFTTTLIITETNRKQPLLLPADLAKGVYHLAVESGTEKETVKLVSLY